MFEWLAQLPLGIQIFIIIVILASLLYVIINVLQRGIIVSKNNTKLIIGEHNGQKKQYTSPHAQCPHSRDIVILLNNIQKILDKKYILIYKEQMQMQMNYAEQKCDELRITFQKFIIEELEKHIKDPNILQLNIIVIKLMLKDIENHILTILRSSFRSNHFDETNEKDFTIYVEEKSQYIIAQIQNLLFDLQIYTEGSMVKLIKLIMINSATINTKIQNATIDIFQYARTLAIDNKVKLLSYDEEIDKILKQYI